MALGLHCSFNALTGRGLEQFVPDTSGPERESLGRASVTGFDLPSWDERPCAKSCHDEEAAGFKMMNFLAGTCQLRCYPEPEGSHPQWNDYLRSVDQAGLKPVLLKATLLCNWTRGPFSKGTHQTRLADAATDLMNRKGNNEEFMNMFSEMTAVDRGLNPDSNFFLTPDEWLHICSKRIPKARGKAWFGIADSFSQLERSWSILSETVSHIKTLQALLKATWSIMIAWATFFLTDVDLLFFCWHVCYFGSHTGAKLTFACKSRTWVQLTMMTTWHLPQPLAHPILTMHGSNQPHGSLFDNSWVWRISFSFSQFNR